MDNQLKSEETRNWNNAIKLQSTITLKCALRSMLYMVGIPKRACDAVKLKAL